MGIRETLNQNPAITTAGTAGIIVVALAFIVYQLTSSGGAPRMQTKAYYTVDDGKTWFADDVAKNPPFDYNGKPAVRVHIFTCDGGKTEFVAYLQKYTEDAKKKLDNIKPPAPGQQPNFQVQEEIQMTGVLVKKPGSDKWFRQMDPAAAAVTEIKCPGDGKIENLEPVLP